MSNSTRKPRKFNPNAQRYNPSAFERKYNHALAELAYWKEQLKIPCSKPKRKWLDFQVQKAVKECRWFENKLKWKYNN